MELLWKLEEDFKEELERRTNIVMYDGITIKELLDLGFNNNWLMFNDEDNIPNYELGWKEENGDYSYELTQEQLNAKVYMITQDYFCDYDTDESGYFIDTDGYHISRVHLMNEEDKVLFMEESEEE